MDPVNTARDAHAWLRWLTGRTVDAAAVIPDADFRREFPIGMGSIHGTLVHLVGAERIWIGVLEGDAAISMATVSDALLASVVGPPSEAFCDAQSLWRGVSHDT